MNVDSKSDLPIFLLFHPASMHDSHGFLHNFFRMKSFLPDFNVRKAILNSAHDAMPYYEYFRRADIVPFIDLNGKGGVKLPYKNDLLSRMTEFLSASPVLKCIMTVLKRRNIVQNSDVLWLIEKTAVPVNIHVLIQSMAELYMLQ